MNFLARLITVVCLFSGTVAQADVLADLNKLNSQLNPASIFLNSAIDHAAEKGDEVLRNNLVLLKKQIEAIIVQVNDMLKQNIERMDDATKNRIVQATRSASFLLAQTEQIAKDMEAKAYEDAERLISQARNASVQVVASLPVPTVAVLPTALQRVLKETKRDTTRLYLAGAGFIKNDGVIPKAYFIGSSAKVELKTYATAGLLTLDIPNNLFRSSSYPQPELIELSLPTGNLFFGKKTRPQTLPVLTCGAMPSVDSTLSISAMGRIWERQRAYHPDSKLAKDYQHGFYKGDNGAWPICATALPGWEVDAEWGGAGYECGIWVEGEQSSPPGGSTYTAKYPRCGCFTIWSNGSKWVAAGNVWVAMKKRVDAPCSIPIIKTLPLAKQGLRDQTKVELPELTRACREPGLSVEPVVSLQVEAKANGDRELASLAPGQKKRMLDGLLSINMDDQGIITAVPRSPCL